MQGNLHAFESLCVFRPSLVLQPCPLLHINLTNFPTALFLGLASKDISWILKADSRPSGPNLEQTCEFHHRNIHSLRHHLTVNDQKKKRKKHMHIETPCFVFKLLIIHRTDLKATLSLGTLVPLKYSSCLILLRACTVQPTRPYRHRKGNYVFSN